jgi:cardiolipin synthase
VSLEAAAAQVNRARLSTRCPIALTGYLFLISYVAGATAAALHALLTKPDPRSVVSWAALCWLFPIGGALLYWLFGINRLDTHAPTPEPVLASAARAQAEVAAGLESAQLVALAGAGATLTGLPLLGGNELELLSNAQVAFPRMLRAIARATRSVHLATYIFQSDAVGRQFIDALASAAARGVRVRVLVDGIGEWYDWPHVVPLLRRAGVTTARFLPPRLVPPSLSLNCRNHRKLLLVDGTECFLGGMNLGGRETGGSTGLRMTDTDFALRGPAVAQLGAVFAADWKFASGESLPEDAPPAHAGSMACRAVTGGPDESLDKLLLLISTAIAGAERQILIMTPYFIPPPELVTALQGAALRGLDVSVIIPLHSNLGYIDWATLHWLPALVSRGVHVYRTPAPFSHAKLFVVDRRYANVGSANLDTRSLRLNFEITLEVFDPRLCGDLAAFIEHFRSRAMPVTVSDLQRESALVRLRNSLCWLVSPYL